MYTYIFVCISIRIKALADKTPGSNWLIFYGTHRYPGGNIDKRKFHWENFFSILLISRPTSGTSADKYFQTLVLIS